MQQCKKHRPYIGRLQLFSPKTHPKAKLAHPKTKLAHPKAKLAHLQTKLPHPKPKLPHLLPKLCFVLGWGVPPVWVGWLSKKVNAVRYRGG